MLPLSHGNLYDEAIQHCKSKLCLLPTQYLPINFSLKKYGKAQNRKLVSVNSIEPWKPHEGKNLGGGKKKKSLESTTAKGLRNRQSSLVLHQAQCKLDSEI